MQVVWGAHNILKSNTVRKKGETEREREREKNKVLGLRSSPTSRAKRSLTKLSTLE